MAIKTFKIEDLYTGLEACAQALRHQRRSPWPKVEYHMLADALYWSDELPKHLPSEASNSLRFLLRYRTSLIEGAPVKEFEDVWLKANQLFPTWIGFRKERCMPNNKLICHLDVARKDTKKQVAALRRKNKP